MTYKTNKLCFVLGTIYDKGKKGSSGGRGAVYSRLGISPTILTMSGGGNKPCVIMKEEKGWLFMNKIINLGNLKKASAKFKNPQTGRVYSIEGISPTINTCQGGRTTT